MKKFIVEKDGKKFTVTEDQLRAFIASGYKKIGIAGDDNTDENSGENSGAKNKK